MYLANFETFDPADLNGGPVAGRIETGNVVTLATFSLTERRDEFELQVYSTNKTRAPLGKNQKKQAHEDQVFLENAIRAEALNAGWTVGTYVWAGYTGERWKRPITDA